MRILKTDFYPVHPMWNTAYEEYGLDSTPVFHHYFAVNIRSWQFTGSAAWFYFTTAADGHLSLR